MGVVGAASGQPRSLEDSDLVILAGASVDYRVGYLSPPGVSKDAFIIRVESDESEIQKGPQPDLAILGEIPKVLDQLALSCEAGSGPHGSWVQTCRERREEFRKAWVEGPRPDGPMTGRDVVDAIRPTLTDEVLFLIDGGNIGQWAHMVLGDRYPSSWLTCGASAVVGWGIPGAMGARLAFPERPILLLSGDGAFGFTVTELESAVRQDLPFVAVVANDSGWGIVVCGQKEAWGGSTVASETREIRFDMIADAVGAKGLRVKDPAQLTRAIKAGFKERVPTVIDVPIRVLSPHDAKKASA
jgi:acetolactate synthase-1/2/3 large subunit